jgi:hypothetical protein
MTSESSDNVLEVFVSDFAERAVAELGQEAAQPIDVVVSRVDGGQIVQRQQFAVSCDSSQAKQATGEMRVKFRMSNGSGSFSAQAIFKELAAETGFSGFAVRGKIRPTDETERVRVTARTNRYNVWDWDNEFRC